MKIYKSLADRINEVRTEADAFIDKRAAEIAKHSPGVPLLVIRNTIAPGRCACAKALKISEEIERETA